MVDFTLDLVPAPIIELELTTGPIGPRGPTGPQGIQGIQGPPGAAASFDSNGSWGSPIPVDPNAVLPFSSSSAKQRSYFLGNGAAVTATLPTPTAAGQEWWLIGCDDLFTVSIVNGGNVILNGDKTLARGSMLKLMSVDTTTWVEDTYNGL